MIENKTSVRDWVVLAGFVLLVFAISGAGAIIVADAPGTWYAGLAKPTFTPPGWLFGPVWTILYISMAVAAWLVWMRRSTKPVTRPLVVFGIQLFLNAIWTPLFFGLHNLQAAMIDLAALWISLLATIILFWRVRPSAGMLLLPYMAWTTFAGVLNFCIVQLN